MEDFGQEYFQLEMGRAITDFQNAQAALLRAKNAATVDPRWPLQIPPPVARSKSPT